MNRIKVVNRKGLENERNFKLAVQLSRIVNTIQSNKRQYLRITDDSDPASLRDRMELILYHAAIIFEAIMTFMKYSKDLARLSTWSSKAEMVKRIQNEANDKDSFTQKYLRPIRNRAIFHYEIEAIDPVLSGYKIKEEAAFAESKTQRDIDIAFILADEILLNFVIGRINEKNPDQEKWAYFQEKLLEISFSLVELLELLTVELARSFTVIDKTDE